MNTDDYYELDFFNGKWGLNLSKSTVFESFDIKSCSSSSHIINEH